VQAITDPNNALYDAWGGASGIYVDIGAAENAPLVRRELGMEDEVNVRVPDRIARKSGRPAPNQQKPARMV
jgi:hypothetical protein